MKLIIEVEDGYIRMAELKKLPAKIKLTDISFSHLVSGLKRLRAGLPFSADIAPVEVTDNANENN